MQDRNRGEIELKIYPYWS